MSRAALAADVQLDAAASAGAHGAIQGHRAVAIRITDAARKHDIAFSAQSVGGMFGLYFRGAPPSNYAEVMQCDKEAFNRFFHAMLERGVYLAPSAYEAGFVSAAHSEADIAATIAAADAAFGSMR